jgi:hypothetical protein
MSGEHGRTYTHHELAGMAFERGRAAYREQHQDEAQSCSLGRARRGRGRFRAAPAARPAGATGSASRGAILMKRKRARRCERVLDEA